MLFKIKYIEKNGVLTKCRPTEINQDEHSSYENNMWKKLVLHATLTHKRPGYKYFLSWAATRFLVHWLSSNLNCWRPGIAHWLARHSVEKNQEKSKWSITQAKSLYRRNLARARPKRRTAARPKKILWTNIDYWLTEKNKVTLFSN